MPLAFGDWWIWLPTLDFKGVGQLAFLVLGLTWVFYRFIKGSQSEHLLRGVFVVLLGLITLWGISWICHLQLLEVVFLAGIFILLIGLIVIFQPELRRTLLVLGQSDIFQTNSGQESSAFRTPEHLVQELCEAVHFLSKSKRGALIVLESSSHQTSHDYLEAGTTLDAQLSTELLLTIFHPNTPLHDGAVIIDSENRIKAAGVLLPLTENPELSWQYGTRHRAAIGLTEISDSRCLVVSEETGYISLVHSGKLLKLENTEELKKTLERLYHVTLKADAKRDKITRKMSNLFGVKYLSNHIQNIFRQAPESSPQQGQPSVEKKTARNG